MRHFRTFAALLLLSAGAAFALQPADDAGGLVARRGRARVRPADANHPEPLAVLRQRAAGASRPDASLAAIVARWSDVERELGARAIAYVDPRSGAPVGVQPDGLPWIPGLGQHNRLTRADIARFLDRDASAGDPPAEGGVSQLALERIARDFMGRHPAWFPVPQEQLYALPEAAPDETSHLRRIKFGIARGGVPVEDALLVFNLNHGNLVSFGGEFIQAVASDPAPLLSPERAAEQALAASGLTWETGTRFSRPARLKYVIEPDAGGAPGTPYRHRLVYEIGVLSAGGEDLLIEIDAATGDTVRLADAREYGIIKGGVFPLSNDGSCPTGCEQAGFPMPYTNTGFAAPDNYTDTGGNYDTTSGTVTTSLNGRYVRISDNCGAISQSATAPADLDLGASSGTDCTVPAGKSAGDTHSSRTAFYNVNKLKEEVRGWLPSWTFNNNQTLVNVNINSTCNAFWTSSGGGSLNMYRDSGSQCRNTGEIAMIFDHEIGHGYDANDGGGSASPGEAYADDTAFIHHHDSCIGRGFFKSGTCGGYGDACSTCSGVRDQNWTKHAAKKPHTIANITGNTGYKCGAAVCTGPCGRECHCESYPIAESMWDLATIDLPHAAIPANGGSCVGNGTAATASQAWTLTSRLWWQSVGGLSAQYSCSATAVTNGTTGCGATNLFHLLKLQDDDNGNLTDGTPHASEIQCAFDRHIAGCRTDNNTSSSSCPAIGTPTVTLTAGPSQITVTWTAASNAVTYRVMRNEEGCGAGYTVIANVAAPTLSYVDTGLLAGRTYYYQVQAVGSNAACEGAPSACKSAAPQAGGSCTAPGGLANNTATDVSACAASGITVSWTAPSSWGDSSGTRTWTVLRDGVAIASGPCSGALAATTLTCTDTPGNTATHAYTVRANNGCGLSTTTAGASAADTNGAPAAPTAVSATTANCADVTVSWTAGAGSTSSNLLRYTGACSSATGLTTFTGVASPYADTTASAGSSYCFVARAVNACGTADAAGVTGTRAAAVGTPGAPTATATCTGINLSWAAVSGATSYNVFRSSGNCASSTQLATGVTATTYSDTTAVAGTAYLYSIQAVNGCGAGTRGACAASVTRPAIPAPTVTGGPAGCSPVALSTQAFTTYQWNLGGSPIGGATAQNYGATATGSYTVTVTNAAGCSGTSAASAITVNTAPTAPVQTAPAAGNQQVTVNWNASSGATTYQVRRGASGGPYSNTGGPQAGLSYLDTGLTNGTQYCYVVTASNGCGASGDSNQQCATPAACVPNVRLNDDFEGGVGGWTISGTWATSTTVAGSPSTSLRGSDPGNNPNRNTCRTAATASAIAIPASSTGAHLRFWSQVALAGDDYGVVEVSVNGGGTWSKLTTVNYPGVVATAPTATCAGALVTGDAVFAGSLAGATYDANLSAFIGQSILVRFNLVTGGTASASSFWYVDDVRVTDGNGIAGVMTQITQAKNATNLVQSWGATTGGENYLVYRDGSPNTAGWTTPAAVPAATATGWTDAGQLSSAVSQFYSVTLYNGCAETAK